VIWLLGDVHSHFDHIERAIDTVAEKPSAVIFLGDIEPPLPLWKCCAGIEARGIEWYWVIGNHDTDNESNYQNLCDTTSMAHNLDGKVCVIDGVRVGGFGGIFRGEVWHPDLDDGKPRHATYAEFERYIRSNASLKRRLTKRDLVQMQAVSPESPHWEGAVLDASRTGKLLKHRSTIFPSDYERMANQAADVLVTHEAPSCHPHGFKEIDRLAQAMGATVIHGHHHDCLDYSQYFDDQGFRAYGVGFCGISSYAPKTGVVTTVVAGDFDESRKHRGSR